jgi:hypothetical protein
MATLADFENFWIDPITLDLVVTQGGAVLGVNGDARISQQCDQAIRPQKGTVPLDSSLGVDWLGLAFGTANEPALRADIGEQLLSVPGVASVDSIVIERELIGPGSARLIVDFEVTTDDDTQVGGQVVIP